MESKIHRLLCELGISSRDSVKKFYPHTRDRKDICVMKCLNSGVLFLSKVEHLDENPLAEKKDFSYWEADSREAVLKISSIYQDDRRRAKQFENTVMNKKWLDVGTGAGGILDLIGSAAQEVMAVEPQKRIRNELTKKGYRVFADINDANEGYFDVVTLFHVLEHISEPIGTLKSILKTLKPGGRVIVEVPHANDFLISFLNLESFKESTFWSDHLILHTRQSLRIFLEHAGFQNVVVAGFQKYPLANHLHWLSRNKPGGHEKWNYLSNTTLDTAYADLLASIDCTDTLIAFAEK